MQRDPGVDFGQHTQADPTATIDSVLQNRFGLNAFRGGQRQVIESLLAGRSAAAIFPTGGGKSLCYQLPAVLLEGVTVVVSPLLALMREQVADLQTKGIGAVRLDSSLTAEENRQVMQDLRGGRSQLLYVAPERFFNERFREFIGELDIALFAIDEAHCISQWGHNFRPDYLKLAAIAGQLDVKRVLALTATATPAVLDDICQAFSIAPEDAVRTEFYRPNLRLRAELCSPRSRDSILLERLQAQGNACAVVYVTLQKTAEDVAGNLQSAGVDARAYHAGLDNDARREVQDWFMGSADAVVVATIAFGMGIDKPDIRGIYHYNPSKSLENLAQEIGRAGRDGLESVCETLLVPEDRIVLDNFAHGDMPSMHSVQAFVEFLAGQPENFFVSYYALAFESDMRDTVVRTLLTYLELEGVLQATASRYETYQFKPLVGSAAILKNFEGERREFASSVLAMAVKKKVWFEIKLIQAAERLKCDRSRMVKMLDYFAEQGWIELRATGLVHGYKKVRPLQNIGELTAELFQYAQERETGELQRRQELFQLFATQECYQMQLSAHFGQILSEPCGHCSVCEGAPLGELPEPDFGKVGDAALTGLKRLQSEYPQQLAERRQQARFLCGLSSPKMIRARLTRHPLYGCCAALPFQQVLQELTNE